MEMSSPTLKRGWMSGLSGTSDNDDRYDKSHFDQPTGKMAGDNGVRMLSEMQKVIDGNRLYSETLVMSPSAEPKGDSNTGLKSDSSFGLDLLNGHQSEKNNFLSYSERSSGNTPLFIECHKGSLSDISSDLAKRLHMLPVVGFMVVDNKSSPGIVVGLPVSVFLSEAKGNKNPFDEIANHNCVDVNTVSSYQQEKNGSHFPLGKEIKQENGFLTRLKDEDQHETNNSCHISEEVQKPQSHTDYNCKHCKHAFISKSQLRQHVKTQHKNGNPYICDVCGNGFPRPDTLDRHKGLHYRTKKFKCPHCVKGFDYYTQWKLHFKVHARKKPYNCVACHKSFASEGGYKYHKQHCKNALLECDMCNFKAVDVPDFKDHQKSHTERENLSCWSCGKKCASMCDLDRHQSLFCKTRALVCSHCNTLFKNKKKLLLHKKLYRIHGKRKYLCLDCGAKFAEVRHLKKHRLLHHSLRDKMSYQCQECFIYFDTKISLSKHTRKVHYKEFPSGCSQEITNFICDLCGFQCSSKWNFEEHFTVSHPTFIPYKCMKCKLRFRSYDGLRDHADTHVGSFLQETFPCSHCFEVFFAEDSLRRHLSDNNIKLHEEELRVLFTKTNNENSNFEIGSELYPKNGGESALACVLKTGEKKSFECDFCTKILSSAFHIKDHFLMYHNSLPPYKCTKCRKRFVAPLLRQRHEVSEHQVDIYEEDSVEVSVGEVGFGLGNENCVMTGTNHFDDSILLDLNSSEVSDVSSEKGSQSRKVPKRKAAQKRSFSQYSFAKIEVEYDERNKIKSPENLKDAKKRVDVIPRAYTVVHCDICGEVLVTAMKAKEHFIKFHNGMGPYKCDICDQRFQSLYIRKNHMLKHQDDTAGIRKRFPCDRCDKTFLKSYSLREHLLRHSQNDEKYAESPGQRVSLTPKRQELVCDLCGTMLVTALKAKEHFIEHHEGLAPYKCFVCDKRLWSMHTRKEHMALHEDFSMLRNTYTCEKCNKTFAKKASLQEHLLRHTKAETAEFVKNELGQYPCKLCTEVFRTLEEVTAHFNDCHDKLGCHEDKTFRRLQVMVCDLCSEKLVTGIKAKTHFVEKHNGLPPYCCSKCDKRFHSAYAKNKHLLSHEENFHELRPKFPCPKCDKVFCSKFTLKKHSAVHLTETEIESNSGEDGSDVVYEVCVEEEDSIEIVEPFESDVEPKPKNRRKGIYSSQQGDLDFSCVYCGSSFRYSHHLVTHMIKQHPEEEVLLSDEDNKFECELCGVALPSFRVTDHFVGVHNGVSLTYCFICDKALQEDEVRDLHVAMHTADEDVYH